jgi:hypothetical protein
MDTTRAYFHAGGKYCLRRAALNIREKAYRALWWLCLDPVRNTVQARSLGKLGVPWWPVGPPKRLVNFGSLAGAYSCARIASFTFWETAGSDESSIGWNWASRLTARASSIFSESESSGPPSICKGVKESELASHLFVVFHKTGLQCRGIPACRSSVRCSTRSVVRLPTSGGDWPGLPERGPFWLGTAHSTDFSAYFIPNTSG